MANKLALVVDDSRVARLTLNKLLFSHGFTVVEQDSGEAALQWLEKQTELPDVIFMDLMMPNMDGINATQNIKSHLGWQVIPVVVCTGNDSELDKAKATESGAIAVLAKPPAPEAVNHILSQLPEKVRPTPTPTPKSQQPQTQPATIDENALLASLQQKLEQQWLPQLRAEFLAQLNQQNQQVTEQSSQQQAAEMEAMKLSLMPDLKQQMQQSIESALSELQQRAASDNSGLQQQAATMLEQAFQGFDVIGQWQSRIQEEASGWLNQQRLNAQTTLQQDLSPLIDEKIQQQLATELNNQLGVALAQQNSALTAQLQRQRADLETAQKRNVTLAWAAIGIALAALIISVI